MKVYSVKFIRGYYIGEFKSLQWSNLRPTIKPTVAIDVRGIDRDILEAYWDYLWRLGEHTFGARYVALRPMPRGVVALERFAEFMYLRLWPKFGRMWTAVGASVGWFTDAEVVMTERKVELGLTSRIMSPYNIILRYCEFLWWGRLVSMTAEDKPVYEQGPPIGPVLLFERRTSRKTPPKIDAWDFGMCWWEIFRVGTKLNLYLWAYGEVEYLGFGVRRSAATVSLR